MKPHCGHRRPLPVAVTLADWTYNGVDRAISAVLGNGIASNFTYDLNDRLTSIQHAKDANDLFHVDYGWDAANRRTFTRDLVDSTNSELYTHDARDRLTQFERGTLNLSGTAITTPTPSTYLIQSREWVSLDRRGSWLDTQTTISSVQTGDTRQRNAVNEYTSWLIGGGPAILPTSEANGTAALLIDQDRSGRRVCSIVLTNLRVHFAEQVRSDNLLEILVVHELRE